MSKGELTRQAILEEAARLVSRVGLRGLTIGSLATRLELSKSGLYAHFRSKEALQVQVLQHAADRFVDEVVRPALRAPRGEPRVRELFERWLKWDREEFGCIFVAVSTELDDDDPGPVRDWMVQNQRDWNDTIATIFRTGVTEGEFHPDADADQFAQDLLGVMFARHHMHRLLGDLESDARARRALDALSAAARIVPDPGDDAGDPAVDRPAS